MMLKLESPNFKVQSRTLQWRRPQPSTLNSQPACSLRTRTAFTLIEMLVVVGIIAVLAAMIIPAGAAAKAARIRSRAKAELNQVDHMIQAYKSKKNTYPPSDPNSSSTNAPYNYLYYELVGTFVTNLSDPDPIFVTLDGNATIKSSVMSSVFGVKGFGNVTQGAGNPEEGMGAQSFTKGTLRQGQAVEVKPKNDPFYILGSSIEGPIMLNGTRGDKVNPIGYNSANPTNNPKDYDLWLDVLVRGKVERITSSL